MIHKTFAIFLEGDTPSGETVRDYRDATAPGATPRFWAIFPQDAWAIALNFAVVDGHPLLAELRVHPREGDSTDHAQGTWSHEPESIPEGGLPATLVKNIPLGDLTNRVRAALGDWTHEAWPGHRLLDHTGEPPEAWSEWRDLTHRSGVAQDRLEPSRRPGRPPLSDEHLAQVAFHYVEALGRGAKTHSYIERRMRQGDEHLPVGQWISKARKRGLLTEATKQGRAGGSLTPRAVEILNRIDINNPHDKGE